MPKILFIRGWSFFFYSDEGNEPMHIHAEKAECSCKYWLHPESFDIEEDYSFGLTPALRREVKELIYENFEELKQAWHKYHPSQSPKRK